MKKLCPNCRRLHGTGELGPGKGITPRSWCVRCATERKSAEKRAYLAEISVRDMLDWLMESELPTYVEEYVVDIDGKLRACGHITDAQEDLIRRTYAKAQSSRYSKGKR